MIHAHPTNSLVSFIPVFAHAQWINDGGKSLFSKFSVTIAQVFYFIYSTFAWVFMIRLAVFVANAVLMGIYNVSLSHINC